VSQWLAARHQFGVGVHGGGVEIVQFMVRAALDASPDWADIQLGGHSLTLHRTRRRIQRVQRVLAASLV
jgi:hypothetical protein